MKDALKELCEVLEKKGLTVEIDSAVLEIGRSNIDTAQKVKRTPIIFRCMVMDSVNEDDIKKCSFTIWPQ